MMVARAAPRTPISGKPNSPKIMIGSRMMLTTQPSACISMGQTMLPVACSIFSMAICTCWPTQPTSTMNR